jgi:hypothetical protein
MGRVVMMARLGRHFIIIIIIMVRSHDVEDPWARGSAQCLERLEPVHDDVTDADPIPVTREVPRK